MTERRTDWIQTYTGRMFFPLEPSVEDVCIEDIAHALSNMCRYTGHVDSFYSVAQHSVMVSKIVPPGDALWGLLHDASEAYLVDLPRPLKRAPQFGDMYKAFERELMRVIAQRFGLPEQEPPSIKEADNILLMTERRDLMKEPPVPWSIHARELPDEIYPWRPQVAECRFLMQFGRLTGGAR